ncbi:hypothetical protein LMG667_02515 [Xanthomonas euvesicatoria]|nr:hypothetical protein LMG667_02515 [Xanthomonas euvesicatoria]
MITQRERTSMATPAAEGVTPDEWVIVDNIIKERSAGFPPRVLAELTRVKPALKRLVDAKVPFREINDRFAKAMQIKISAAQFRKYMKVEFDYPPSPTKPKAKKTAKKAAKASRS